MKAIRWVFAPILALGCAVPLLAAEAGSVSGVNGPVSVLRGTTVINARVGTPLQTGDVLVTGDGGNVRWSTPDEGMMALSSNSRLAIESYAWGSGEGSSHYQLRGGGVSVISGEIQAPGYKLSTPAADLTINGTKYKSIVCKGSCPGFADGMYVIVSEGSVTVSNKAGTLSGSAGQAIFVAGPDSAPVLVDGAPVVAVNFDLDFQLDQDAFGDIIERQLSPS